MAVVTTGGGPGRAGALAVRAPRPEEARRVAWLWRELWDVHETWGGYLGTRDPDVYEGVAQRIADDARARRGSPLYGRHVHLVATLDDAVVGQVEGWIDRSGYARATPVTCEVRSLVVAERARGRGAGEALLAELGRVATEAVAPEPVVLAAEVLEPNPAHAFYARAGFRVVAHAVRLGLDAAFALPSTRGLVARLAGTRDARQVAELDHALSAARARRRDVRFDAPRALDAAFVDAIALHLAAPQRSSGPIGAMPLVVEAERGAIVASGLLSTMHLDPPFEPQERAVLARLSARAGSPPGPLVAPLLQAAAQRAARRGARTLEIVDLDPPGAPLHAALLALGAVPWSRVVLRPGDAPGNSRRDQAVLRE